MSATKPHKPDSGVLFGNKEEWVNGKKGRPGYSGEVNLCCPSCKAEFRRRVAGWKRFGQASGKQFLSLEFSEAKEQAGKGGAK